MEHNTKNIIENFNIEDKFVFARPFGSGHINDTYMATFEQGKKISRYILQRINHEVFKKPAQVMENMTRVTEHISKKLLAQGVDEISRYVVTLIKTRDDESYYIDDKGNHWRVSIFINNARTYDVPQTLDNVYEAAKAFGSFQSLLLDLPAPPLHETIPDFHNSPKRFENFKNALKADLYNRAITAKNEIDFLMANSSVFDVLPKLVAENKIPIRTTHNDCKINNVMIDDRTGEGICVIDLDTVMPGLSLCDFGDIVRTSVTSANEDECDLSKVHVQMPQFEAIVRGYLSSAGAFLNKDEKKNLLVGAKTIIMEQAVRFLTDHLAGDTYYKIHRLNHNLDRCRTQFKLIRSVIEQQEQMEALVGKFC